MNRELAYIRNGKVNENAAAFTIPVSDDLDAVHLAWKLLPNVHRGVGKDPVSSTVSYRIFISTKSRSISNELRRVEDAMYQPSLNISHQGQLSIKEDIVRISLPCTGMVEAIVEIDITISFNIQNRDKESENVELSLKREKTCSTSNPMHGQNGRNEGDQEHGRNGKLDTTFVAIIVSALIITIFTIIFIILINWKGCEFIFGVGLTNDKTMATTTTFSSNTNKNNPRFIVGQQQLHPTMMSNQFAQPMISPNNEDMTNPYEAITNPGQGPEANVLTYSDAGLLTMDPRSANVMPTIHMTEQPPPPPLPPPMPSNMQYIKNSAGGGRGFGGVFRGNKFEFVGAEFNSDAESRVTDWVNQHQKQHEALNVNLNQENFNPAESQNRNPDAATLTNNYSGENGILGVEANPAISAETIFENLQVDRHRLKLGCLLQEGTFGRVYQVRNKKYYERQLMLGNQ